MFIKPAITALVLLFAINPLQAAEFTLTPNHPDGCTFQMTGQIENGDLERFKSFAKSEIRPLGLNANGDVTEPFGQTRPFMCMDSVGGSLGEALRIGDFLHSDDSVLEEEAAYGLQSMATVVPNGARCESACAVLFMAGQISEGDFGRSSNRYLHIGGKLGFHAPSLVVQNGQYTEESVNQAFAVAIDSIGQLMKRRWDWDISGDLLAEMITTPNSSMAYIGGPETAHAFGIHLFGFKPEDLPQKFEEKHALQLCDFNRSKPFLSGAEDLSHTYKLEDPVDNPNIIIAKFETIDGTTQFDMGEFDEGGYRCTGTVHSGGGYWGEISIESYSSDYGNSTSRVYPWMLLSPEVCYHCQD